jgi:Gluconate 2-dehydrogenase subunit 3
MTNDSNRMDRRQAIKWMLTAAAAVSVPGTSSFAAHGSGTGYGRDPNLMNVYKPGDFWPLTLSARQHRTVGSLCEVLLPADERSPSASELKVPDFIDEWISAPYPAQHQDRKVVLWGLEWLDKESKKRFGREFTALAQGQQAGICDDICSFEKAPPRFRRPAAFFRTFRNIAMSGFYTTPEGMKDLQYVGNVPLLKFTGPPPVVLAYLKLRTT